MDAKACKKGQEFIAGKCREPYRYTRYGLDPNTDYVLIMDGKDLVGRLPLDPVIESELDRKGWKKK